MQINVNDFVPKRRPLPVIVLADASTSMQGEKLATLNAAIAEMQQKFMNLHDARGHIHIGMITFASNAQQILPVGPIEDITLPTITASGTTAMGAAFKITHQVLEDEQQMSKRSWLPTIVLVSDGQPNDDWEEPLQQLLSSSRGGRAVRLAVGIGDDCDFGVLKRFVNHAEVPVMRANDVSKLMDFFRFVTYSVMSRSTARDPNSSSLPLYMLNPDDLEFK